MVLILAFEPDEKSSFTEQIYNINGNFGKHNVEEGWQGSNRIFIWVDAVLVEDHEPLLER